MQREAAAEETFNVDVVPGSLRLAEVLDVVNVKRGNRTPGQLVEPPVLVLQFPRNGPRSASVAPSPPPRRFVPAQARLGRPQPVSPLFAPEFPYLLMPEN